MVISTVALPCRYGSGYKFIVVCWLDGVIEGVEVVVVLDKLDLEQPKIARQLRSEKVIKKLNILYFLFIDPLAEFLKI
jgi:hypothetical protein